MREIRGAISRINESHLPITEASIFRKPVMLPPGCARLETNPLPTGSDTHANTVGIVRVSACNAAVAGVLMVTSASGFLLDQLPREQAHAVYASGAPAIIDTNAATVDPSQFNEPLAESGIPSLGLNIGLGE